MKVKRLSDGSLAFKSHGQRILLSFTMRRVQIIGTGDLHEASTMRTLPFTSVTEVNLETHGRHFVLGLVLGNGERLELGTIEDRQKALRTAWTLGHALRTRMRFDRDPIEPPSGRNRAGARLFVHDDGESLISTAPALPALEPDTPIEPTLVRGQRDRPTWIIPRRR